jgi:ATP-dependent protease ClpP protease subunit
VSEAPRSPLFAAENEHRYNRQQLIRQYEAAFECRLAVMVDVVWPHAVTALEETIFDADPQQPLHLILDSPGGDGETAVRLIRSCMARCSELVIVVPDQAKSAATIFAL